MNAPPPGLQERLIAAADAKLATLPEDPDERSWVLASKADYFAAASLKVRPKDDAVGLVPFVYNPIQMDYLAGLRMRYRATRSVDMFRGVRDLILKPRQLGFTTFLASLFFIDGLFNPGRNCLVLTHLDKVSQKVLEIYRAFYESLPDEIKATVRLRRASALHLELEFLDERGMPDPIRRPPSSFIVHTAAGFDLRGITVHNLHCSEAAFYDNWAEIVRGVFQAVPASGNIVLESTANGFNHYKDLTDSALKGSGVWRLVFYPWFAHPEYARTLTVPEAVALEADLLEDERTLRLERGVTLEQLAWRRAKISEMGGSSDSFRQEYPATILDAFLSSGRPVFDPRIVAENFDRAKAAPAPLRPDAFTAYWAMPEPGGVYVLSADPSEGLDRGEGDAAAEIGGTDFSSASVRDARTLRVMATIHGRLDPADFARRVAALGHEFNDALVVVERNNHGHLVLFVLEEAGYPNLYRHLEYDAAGQSFLKLGFPMTVATRPLVVDTLKEVIARNAHPDPDPRFWGEAQVFVYGPTGKAEAMPTRHDDRVMDRAIGTYICTLGAKAWGGSGILRRADDAGLPRAPGDTAPPPPTSRAARLDTTPKAPALDLYDAQPAHPIFHALRPVPEAPPEPGLRDPGPPRCSNCLHLQEKNGQTVCGAFGWTTEPSAPPCDRWEPKEVAGYNDDEPPPRVFLGGPHA